MWHYGSCGNLFCPTEAACVSQEPVEQAAQSMRLAALPSPDGVATTLDLRKSIQAMKDVRGRGAMQLSPATIMGSGEDLVAAPTVW
ncbi:hypothetical protein Rhe02_69510 [Rhizocola hellebori]|uniref:Uncharacterized protein n=1 Tax=Rhizocola hellebori TaxID=1392758 RepID=A0A8J3QFU7_9ACTN|nr:hypothetical protein Rhe02_69510 [Rhizocola hellebori]